MEAEYEGQEPITENKWLIRLENVIPILQYCSFILLNSKFLVEKGYD